MIKHHSPNKTIPTTVPTQAAVKRNLQHKTTESSRPAINSGGGTGIACLIQYVAWKSRMRTSRLRESCGSPTGCKSARTAKEIRGEISRMRAKQLSFFIFVLSMPNGMALSCGRAGREARRDLEEGDEAPGRAQSGRGHGSNAVSRYAHANISIRRPYASSGGLAGIEIAVPHAMRSAVQSATNASTMSSPF